MNNVGGGCTSDVAFMPDFGPIKDYTLDNNLLPASASSSYCLYAGYVVGKPHAEQVQNVIVTNNVFQRGQSGMCGVYGVADSYRDGNGNVWQNNRFDDGAVIPIPK